jgi:MSHA biogenesis protein MshQ
MQRWLLVPALVAGCGNVATPTADAPAGTTDLLSGTLRQGCVLALHMDESAWTGSAGEIHDDCGNDNPGTLNGAANTVPNGAQGRAGSFSGNACIDIEDATTLHGTTGLTLSAWILPTALNGMDANGVISKRIAMGNQSEYNLYVWTGNHVYVDLDGEDTRFNGTALITNNAWQQLTMVFDGTRPAAQRARVFVNGTLDVTMPETSASLTAYTSTLHVGCMPAATSPQNFIGELDEVVIWNRALSDAEVLQWYMTSKP